MSKTNTVMTGPAPTPQEILTQIRHTKGQVNRLVSMLRLYGSETPLTDRIAEARTILLNFQNATGLDPFNLPKAAVTPPTQTSTPVQPPPEPVTAPAAPQTPPPKPPVPPPAKPTATAPAKPPKPKPAPKKPEPPTFVGEDMTDRYEPNDLLSMAEKPRKWSLAKQAAVKDKKNINIHPDSIDADGIIEPNPWTWTAVSAVMHTAHNTPVACLSKDEKVNQSEARIRALMDRCHIREYRPDPDRAPKPEPQPAPEPPKPAVRKPQARQVPGPDDMDEATKILTMKHKPADWSAAKWAAAMAAPKMHPDIIDNEGKYPDNIGPWLWSDVKFVLDNATTKTVEDHGGKTGLARSVGQSPAEVRALLARVGLKEHMPDETPEPEQDQEQAASDQDGPAEGQETPAGTPFAAQPEASAPNAAAGTPSANRDTLDACLPKEARQPSDGRMLRALRLWYDVTPGQISVLTGVGERRVTRFEEGKSPNEFNDAQRLKLGDFFSEKFKETYGGPITFRLGKTPAKYIMPVERALTVHDRLRAVRCRMALQPDAIADKLGLNRKHYMHLEHNCTSRFMLDYVMSILGVDTAVFDDLCDEPSRLPCDMVQTGLNVAAIMETKAMTDKTVAKALGIREAELTAIKSGHSSLTFRLAAGLAYLFQSDTNAFYAVVEPD